MSWWQVFRCECQAIFTNSALLLTVFGGVVMYSFLYPLPYSQQLPREQAIVVVNLDNTATSRELERMVDATPQVEILQHAYSLKDAQYLLNQGDVHGILVIPKYFSRDLLLGKSPTLAYAGDAAYFLIYGTVVEGLASAGGTLSAKAKVSRMVMSGENLVLASNQYAPVKLSMQPVFNPSNGYVNYVVPAVFVLILHQTLLIAAGLVGGEQNESRRAGITGYWQRSAAIDRWSARLVILLLTYIPLALYYFGFSFQFYGISRLASIGNILAVLIPFLAAVIGLGMVMGELIPRRELATLIVVLSSLPLVFCAGFIWPTSELPFGLQYLAQFFPSTPAINGFLRLNQMGASFQQVLPYWGLLWAQAVTYGGLALWLMARKNKGDISEAKES
ncbi:ABC transporter permease [Vibrio sp. S17_S38]|uniref:ABC transporter permease n=1 Tax=Vibrio sp. S17_S38 TaxID=2720229 RepID=UPI001680E889|nr:ABC transporter permease [Vibrio sp. S17_S38]MBD1574603.1 ABC transporter permease [Vibrio sp. S17_S38]